MTELGYSKKLIAKCQKVFGEKAERKISAKEAEEFLDRLAMLGKLAVESFKSKKTNKLNSKDHVKNNNKN
jgi:hypothetical protein